MSEESFLSEVFLMGDVLDQGPMPGEITVKRDDGIWVRNDGLELSPPDQNPWYVLATAHGEQGDSNNTILAKKNRRIWNGWSCSELNDHERENLADKLGIACEELAPLNAREELILRTAIAERLGKSGKAPESKNANLQDLYFMKPFNCVGFVFLGGADFSRTCFVDFARFDSAYFAEKVSFAAAHFVNAAIFNAASFAGTADFKSSYFARAGSFSSANLSGSSVFEDAYFEQSAHFSMAHFEGHATFLRTKFGSQAGFMSARFDGPARFDFAIFREFVSFDDGSFESPASFRDACFLRHVPRFFHRKFHDDTSFTNEKGNWPKVSKNYAAKHKDAYRRLRQISNVQQHPENEHFFLRQEMACDAKLKTGLSRLVIQGFGLLSDYGYSLWRPAIGLAVTAFGGALTILLMYFARAHVYEPPPPGMEMVPGMFDAFSLGVANTLAIFGFQSLYWDDSYMRSLPTFVKFVGGLQAIFGFVFLFFLGLGLRNRFRLK